MPWPSKVEVEPDPVADSQRFETTQYGRSGEEDAQPVLRTDDTNAPAAGQFHDYAGQRAVLRAGRLTSAARDAVEEVRRPDGGTRQNAHRPQPWGGLRSL